MAEQFAAAVNAPALTRAGSRRPGARHGTNIAPRSPAGTTYPAARSALIALPIKTAYPAERLLAGPGWLHRAQAGGADPAPAPTATVPTP